ncbi:DUF937 domain-containing protein [Marixanthomonas sp. SCSIO 43207]|uniref:DUF937 domain-containing protein n=1 Tax=Marixanthomonas sp. SCSIO 43207 TaxID=2779360 RepID=UPI001CA9B1E7|nr:DUF937 domain-containing protein [Marixanthomonas sp. SCSIO 43207]UAB80747.1 DUF937 domain-containing protein [Marixanthomonas sp. SCSIO 43207]
MAGILDLLNSDTGKQIISGISNETKQPADKTASVLSMGLPILMGAMKRNANSQEGAMGLMNALSNSKHDGNVLDNLSGFFGGGVNEDKKIDGLGILGHVLGGSQDNVVGALSKKSGIDSSSVMQILQVAAPILLGYLGKEKRQQNVDSQSGITSLLGNLMAGNTQEEQQKEQSLIESLLDGDNDGSIIDDVAGMVLGGSKKGGLGDMLGGFFGK